MRLGCAEYEAPLAMDSPMNVSRIACVAILLLVGCGRYTGLPAGVEAKIEAARREKEGLARSLQTLTNVHPILPSQKLEELSTPEFSRSAESIELKDLGIVLRLVPVPPEVHAAEKMHFSEAEITNRQYAAFLQATAQQRDDSELLRVELELNQSTTIVQTDGTRITFGGAGGGTASPAIGVHQPEMHWRNNTYPAGQDDYPVTFLTTAQAGEFCNWLTARYELPGFFRLPSEQEWLAAAYGETRKYPWGDDERDWTGKSSEPVLARPELRTPEGLYGMWGNVSELVLSASNGYGGKVPDFREPMITVRLGPHYEDKLIRGLRIKPRQDDFGYSHSTKSRSDIWGFRIVFVPE